MYAFKKINRRCLIMTVYLSADVQLIKAMRELTEKRAQRCVPWCTGDGVALREDLLSRTLQYYTIALDKATYFSSKFNLALMVPTFPYAVPLS